MASHTTVGRIPPIGPCKVRSMLAPNPLLWGEVASWTSANQIGWGSIIDNPRGEQIGWSSDETTEDSQIVWAARCSPHPTPAEITAARRSPAREIADRAAPVRPHGPGSWGNTWTRVAFNAVTPALSIWVAAQVSFLLVRIPPLSEGHAPAAALIVPLFCLTAIYFGLNSGLTSIAVGLEAQQSPIVICQDLTVQKQARGNLKRLLRLDVHA